MDIFQLLQQVYGIVDPVRLNQIAQSLTAQQLQQLQALVPQRGQYSSYLPTSLPPQSAGYPALQSAAGAASNYYNSTRLGGNAFNPLTTYLGQTRAAPILSGVANNVGNAVGNAFNPAQGSLGTANGMTGGASLGNAGGNTGRYAPPNAGTNRTTASAVPADPWAAYKERAQLAGVDWNVLNKVYLPQYEQTRAGFGRALDHAVQDGMWAQLFSRFIGRPPNEVEWNEHYNWFKSNGRTRDPLLEPGHNVAVQEWERLKSEYDARNQTPSTPLPYAENNAPKAPPPEPVAAPFSVNSNAQMSEPLPFIPNFNNPGLM